MHSHSTHAELSLVTHKPNSGVVFSKGVFFVQKTKKSQISGEMTLKNVDLALSIHLLILTSIFEKEKKTAVFSPFYTFLFRVNRLGTVACQESNVNE